MRMSDVRVGMQLRPTYSYSPGRNEVEVTEITERGFKYRLVNGGYCYHPRLGLSFTTDGHEAYASADGTVHYKPLIEPTQAAIELANYIHAWWSDSDDLVLTPAQRAQQFLDSYSTPAASPDPAHAPLADFGERQAEVDAIEAAAFLRGRAAGKSYADTWREQHEKDKSDRQAALAALKIGLKHAKMNDTDYLYISEDVRIISAAIARLEESGS